MHFEPIEFRATVEIDKNDDDKCDDKDQRPNPLRFLAYDTAAVTFWDRRCEPNPERVLKIIRAFRQDGEREINPFYWTLENKGQHQKVKGASRALLTFNGPDLTADLLRLETDPLHDFKAEFRANGSRSLYEAFVSNERVQFYVVGMDKEQVRTMAEKHPMEFDKEAVSLGALLVQLRYGR